MEGSSASCSSMQEMGATVSISRYCPVAFVCVDASILSNMSNGMCGNRDTGNEREVKEKFEYVGV